MAINQNALRRKKRRGDSDPLRNGGRKRERMSMENEEKRQQANLLGEAEGVNGAVSYIPVEEAVRILSSDNGEEERNEEEEERGGHCEE